MTAILNMNVGNLVLCSNIVKNFVVSHWKNINFVIVMIVIVLSLVDLVSAELINVKVNVQVKIIYTELEVINKTF